MRFFTNGILVLAAAALCSGCGFVRSVGLDARVQTPPPKQVPHTYFTIGFATTSGKHLCGGEVSVTSFPALDKLPPTIKYDIRYGEARVRVAKGIDSVVVRVSYPRMDFPARTITFVDSSGQHTGVRNVVLTMPIGGGC